MGIKIGPAGLGPVKNSERTLEEYGKKGFRACEIAFTYSVYIKSKEDAERIRKKADELGIFLSVHCPYFLNLNSAEKAKREATKQRILKCCEVGEWLGAERAVFHPGYYGNDKEKAYDSIKEGIEEIMSELKRKKWKIKLAPETMGRVNVFGSVEEISRLVKDTECDFCIDFAHILAREKIVDYAKIKKLFPQKIWHCHFSGIVYGDKGEKRHKKTEKKEWEELLKNLPRGKNIVIINESPAMIEDCVEGMKIADKLY